MARKALYKAHARRHTCPMHALDSPARPARPQAAPAPIPVALLHCPDYAAPDLGRIAAQALEAGRVSVGPGLRVLVKPNLVSAQALACSDPRVVAAACGWLLEHGARVQVADSPGFGSAASVAQAVGLTQALKPLGLAVGSLNRPVPLRLDTGACFKVARQALDCDLILSVPRVKAHGQMLVTLAVKNLFGCVSGLRKALIHAREGREPAYFADCLAALQAALPPVAGLADGVSAMHVTGPSKGRPFALRLLGASASAVALDRALCAVLGVDFAATPLGAALERRKAAGSAAGGGALVYPLLRPGDIDAQGFELPGELAHTSFHPARLVKSCGRRVWARLAGARAKD